MNQGPYSNHGTDLHPDSFGGEDYPANGVQPLSPERPRRDVIPPPAQVARVGRSTALVTPVEPAPAEPSLRPAPTIAVTRRVLHSIRGCDIAAEWARCFNVIPAYVNDGPTIEVPESEVRSFMGRGRNASLWTDLAGDARALGESGPEPGKPHGDRVMRVPPGAALALLIRRNLIPCGDYLIDTRGREAL